MLSLTVIYSLGFSCFAFTKIDKSWIVGLPALLQGGPTKNAALEENWLLEAHRLRGS